MKINLQWFFYLPIYVILVSAASSVTAAEPPLFVVHFETGPQWQTSLPPGQQIGFAEHSANLSRLRKEGTITFGARYAEFGMIIIHAKSLESARELIDADPGIKAGIFTFQVEPLNVFYPWQDK